MWALLTISSMHCQSNRLVKKTAMALHRMI